MSFIKRVLDCMFETNNTSGKELCAASGMQAVRLAKGERRRSGAGAESQNQQGQLTGPQAENILKALVDEGWFERSKKGWYSLSARALMELRGWLVETYNDDEEEDDDGRRRSDRIKFCHGCKDMVTVGQRCPKKSCQCRLHDGCAEGVFRVVKARKCPVCKTEWSGKDFVGERAATMEKEPERRRKSGGGRGAETGTHRRGTQRDRAEKYQDEEDEEDEEAEQGNRNGYRDEEEEDED